MWINAVNISWLSIVDGRREAAEWPAVGGPLGGWIYTGCHPVCSDYPHGPCFILIWFLLQEESSQEWWGQGKEVVHLACIPSRGNKHTSTQQHTALRALTSLTFSASHSFVLFFFLLFKRVWSRKSVIRRKRRWNQSWAQLLTNNIFIYIANHLPVAVRKMEKLLFIIILSFIVQWRGMNLIPLLIPHFMTFILRRTSFYAKEKESIFFQTEVSSGFWCLC